MRAAALHHFFWKICRNNILKDIKKYTRQIHHKKTYARLKSRYPFLFVARTRTQELSTVVNKEALHVDETAREY